MSEASVRLKCKLNGEALLVKDPNLGSKPAILTSFGINNAIKKVKFLDRFSIIPVKRTAQATSGLFLTFIQLMKALYLSDMKKILLSYCLR